MAAGRAHTEEMVGVAEITVVLGSVGLFVAGFVSWYTLWHRRVTAAFERVPVGADRSAHVLRRGIELGGEPK
jgi:hypothetical protein